MQLLYKEMIDSYLKDVNRTPTKEETLIMDQWKEISNLGQKKEAEISQRENEEQISEMDMLWREMEMALTSSYLEEVKFNYHVRVRMVPILLRQWKNLMTLVSMVTDCTKKSEFTASNVAL
ncbi:SNF2 domain-containing protein CLASSY 2, partial [Mucuna pruriens]